MPINKTPAIILKTFDYRETSKIVRLFTRDYGKVSGIMKGVRKDPKKFGSSVDKFSVNYIVYYEYHRTDLHLIAQCDLTRYYFPIRRDYKRNMAASYAIELVDVIMPSGEVNKNVYSLLLEFLESLSIFRDIDKLVHLFQVKILQLSGFSPHLDSCVKTGKKIVGKARFSMRLGGLVAPEVVTTENTFTVISRGAIQSILHIEQNSWTQALRLGLTPSVRRELKYILNNFLVYHLEKRIKSAQYL